jgi:hypothetical protein
MATGRKPTTKEERCPACRGKGFAEVKQPIVPDVEYTFPSACSAFETNQDGRTRPGAFAPEPGFALAVPFNLVIE